MAKKIKKEEQKPASPEKVKIKVKAKEKEIKPTEEAVREETKPLEKAPQKEAPKKVQVKSKPQAAKKEVKTEPIKPEEPTPEKVIAQGKNKNVQEKEAEKKSAEESVKPKEGEKQKKSAAPTTEGAKEVEKELAKGPNEISIIKLVDDLVASAFKARASDIHIDPTEKNISVRFRIDGILHDFFTFPKKIQSEVVSRIKVLSGLRTDEHQAAQDGRFRLRIGEINVDVRVSIAPTYYGENVVMRLLSEKSADFTLEGLGFRGKDLEKILRNIKKPYGMILSTGPTGSGKTTTLYTILKMLNTKEVAIITIEDPVEYAIEGIEQIQVNQRTGLTFAKGLRSILRQDPNIVMVGEIRDEETAGIAVNAALTGHLLLSTLHTNDAPTTLPRLLDMKIEPFLIASTVNVAVGQRLVRKICPDCKVKKELKPEELKSLTGSLPPELLKGKLTFYEGKGCSACDKSGYKGRLIIAEVLEMDDEIRLALMRNADSSEIKKLAIKNGMTTMIEDGFRKALEGVTTLEEILRVIHE